MTIILSFIRFGLLAFSLSALIGQAKKQLGCFEFALPVVFSAIGSALFLAGILNILREVSLIIFITGLFLGIRALFTKQIVLQKPTYAMLFASIISAALLFMLFDTRLIVYDDFSHWANVLKYTLANNRFPNFADRHISHTSYQLGSTGILYFVIWITGIHAEWFSFWIYALLQLSMFLPMLAFARSVFSRFVIGISICIMLMINGGIGTLVVDTLLPGTMAAGLMLCLHDRTKLRERYPAILLICIFLVSIKTTGVLYAALLIGFTLYRIGFQPQDRRLLFAAVIPFIVWYLWLRHVDLVFANGMDSRHAVSISWFTSVLHGKSIMDIVKLTAKMGIRFILPTNPFVWIVLFWFCERHFAKKKGILPSKNDQEIEWFILGSTIIYEIGLWAMYVFSMPQPDAAILSSYERYYCTHMIVVFALALVRYADLLNGIRYFEETPRIRQTALALCLVLCFSLAAGLCHIVIRSIGNMFDAGVRQQYEQIIADNELPSDSRYLLILTDDDWGYAYYLFTYLLDPIAVQYMTAEAFIRNNQAWADYDYLIIPDSNNELDTFLNTTLHVEQRDVIPTSTIRTVQVP